MLEFLDSKKEWIDKTLASLNKKRDDIDQQIRQREGEILLRGEWKPMVIAEKERSKVWLFKEGAEHVEVHRPEPFRSNGVAPPTPVLQAFYRNLAKRDLLRRFELVAAELPYSYNRVFVRSQKTKWGSCSGLGNLSFNWRLIKCPVWIWDYLFVHELCHLEQMNHSPAYWKLVERYFPDYKKAKLWIRQNERLIFSDP